MRIGANAHTLQRRSKNTISLEKSSKVVGLMVLVAVRRRLDIDAARHCPVVV
jgi:hypothetical protein